MPNLTEAQKHALAWLPADRGWQAVTSAPEKLGLISLYNRCPYLVEANSKTISFRLTAAGLALKAEMEATRATQGGKTDV